MRNGLIMRFSAMTANISENSRRFFSRSARTLNEREDDPNYVLFEPITVFTMNTILRPINEIENFNDVMNECFTTHPELMESVEGVPFPPDTTHVVGYHGWHFPITPDTGQSEVKKIAQMI